MPQNSPGNTVRLGLFTVLGVGFLLAMLYLMGRQQNLFGHSLVVQADFRNMSGLLTGNSVRLGGINVGSVKAISLLNYSTVRGAMSLKDAQRLVRQNAVATIGTDGLVGNTIINLTAPPAPAPPVRAGDVLRTKTPVSIDAILGTLDVLNKNLVVITQSLRQIATKLDTSALWQLLNDKHLPAHVRQSLGHVAASAQLQRAATDVAQLAQGVHQGRGPLGYLLTDNKLLPNSGTPASSWPAPPIPWPPR